MSDSNSAPVRYVGLDIHKAYLVAAAVNADQEAVYGPRRVPLTQLSDWIVSDLLCTDRVVLEMTTNTWAMCDALAGHVASVTVVHPPQVALIVRARVMTDRKAALILAQLHAAHLLPAVWIPSQPVRDLRTLIAQRQKMVRLTTTARNRLHAVLHRHHLLPPLGQGELFSPELRSWWQDLPLSEIEAIQVQCDLDTLAFARAQQERLQAALNRLAARDERVPLLVQLPGIGVTSAMTILAAIGEIGRFPEAKHLVGYAGLGARVHDSGQKHTTGKLTKHGRRDLRTVMVEAAHHAARHHAHWREQHQRLAARIGSQKAFVAVARKLLVAVWHVLSRRCVDRFGAPDQIAATFFAHAYRIGISNLPDGLSARQYVRRMLDQLGIGQELTRIRWGSKWVTIPPSPEV